MMKLTVTILACGLAAGLASAQSPSMVQNVQSTMTGVSSNATAASNQALGDPQTSATAAKRKAKKSAAVPGTHNKIVAVPKEATASTGDENATNDEVTNVDPKYQANGRRDPFVSPVVSHAASSSNCTTGKKCLEIGAINLRGVVRSENGFIAVVSNNVNKAYFLRENDPVFNGFVMKITGDSIVFRETLQDRLGKTFTREVVKKITTPAV
jgi:hypothetical protein